MAGAESLRLDCDDQPRGRARAARNRDRSALGGGRRVGAGLAAALPDAEGARVLLVRASLADPDLPAGLRERGAVVQEITAYETVEGPTESAQELRTALDQRDIAAVVFASGSAVRGFLKLGGATSLPAVTIGPRTTAVARDAGFTVITQAAGPNVHQLASAVERAIPLEAGKDA